MIDKHLLFGEIMGQFEPYFKEDHPFRVANALISWWFYPKNGLKNPHAVKSILGEWDHYIRACKEGGHDAPPMPPILVQAMLELNDLELSGDRFKGQKARKLRVESEKAEAFGFIYRALAMGSTLGQASRMVALRYYILHGKHVLTGKKASSIEDSFSEHHGDPCNNLVKKTVVARIKAIADSDPKVMEGWRADVDEFERLEKQYHRTTAAIYGVRR